MVQRPSDIAYDKIKELLFASTLRAGQFVTQNDLLGHVQMSLGPVRTALARLEVEGFIRILPQKGVQVVEPSISLYRDITHVRLVMEKEAWGKFAQDANADRLEGMERRHRDLMARAERKITAALLREASEYDRSMHIDVVGSLGNDLFRDIFRVNLERLMIIRPGFGDGTSRGNHIRESTLLLVLQEHLDVIRACIARKPEAAIAAAEIHLTNSFHRFMAM